MNANVPPSSHPRPPNSQEFSIDENDILIAVMGITGAGRSSFINTATGMTAVAIGNDLKSCTRAVQPVRCRHPDSGRSVVLVDTPGFNHTHYSDGDVLNIISNWLKETFRGNTKRAGLLYLYRVSDESIATTPPGRLSIFKAMCGDNNLKNVVLVTTMWDKVQDETIGSKREKMLLSEFWMHMVHDGSRTCRFRGTRESAWEIINSLDLEGSRETAAAKASFLTQVRKEAQSIWRRLRDGSRIQMQ